MTRKRFIKTLMSKGVSRNKAQVQAQYARARGSYAKGYEAWKRVNSLSEALDGLSEGVRDLAKGLSVLCSAFGVAVSAFSSAFSVALQDPSPFGDTCLRCGGTGTVPQMQSMAQFDGPSVRGPDRMTICPRCLGTGRNLYKEENQ